MTDESTVPTSAFDPTNGSLPGRYYDFQSLGVAQRVVLCIMFLMISITGIIGNSIVILAIVLSRKLRSTLNWFVLNLACADLVTSICLPFYVASLLISQFEWTFKFWIFVISACVGVSLTIHAFIGFTSWYLITRNQVKLKKIYKARNVCLMIAFMWVLNFSLSFLIGVLDEVKRLLPLAVWIFGHFAIVVTVYLKLWRFIAHRAEKLKPTKKVDEKTQHEICKDTSCPDENTVTQQGGLVNENTVLRVSHSSEHLGNQNCELSKGEKSGQLENPMQDAKTVTVSPSLEAIESTCGESDIGAKEVPVHVDGSDTKLPVKKQTQPKIDKKLLAVTKNLLVILLAFVICFIPYAVTLCLALSYSSDSYRAGSSWLFSLLLFNSCINPIIYARRIRVFREVMVCIIRCRLGSIPMPIDLVRKMRTTS